MTSTTAMAAATTNSTAPLPSPAEHNRNTDMPPLTAILCLLALISIPLAIYTLLVALKFPRNPFRGSSRSGGSTAGEVIGKTGNLELVYGGAKYKKDASTGKELGNDCPVCLSAFAEGEEIRQLNSCKHAFHVACIDKWLNSHSNCPVCRSFVAVKRPKRSSGGGEDDLRQGLPDAVNLMGF